MKRRSLLGAALAALALPFRKLFRRKPRDIVILNSDYGMSIDEIMRAQPTFSIGGKVNAWEGNVITDFRLDSVSIDWTVRPTTDKDKLPDEQTNVCTIFKV